MSFRLCTWASLSKLVNACLSSHFLNWDNAPSFLDLFSSLNRLQILNSTNRSYGALMPLSEAKTYQGWSVIAMTALHTNMRTKLCVLPGLKKLWSVPWSSVPSFGQSRTFYYLVSNFIYLIFGLLLILLMTAGLNSLTHSKFTSRLMTTKLFSEVCSLVVLFDWFWFALAHVLWRARALHHALLFPPVRTGIRHYIVS